MYSIDLVAGNRRKIMLRRFLFAVLTLSLVSTSAIAGSEGSEKMSSKRGASVESKECFEKLSRGIFKFNHALDNAVFEPVSKGYRKLPVPIRKSTGNVIDNLRSLLTLSNNVLQGDIKEAGNTAGRFLINSTVGILGVFDPAEKMGLAEKPREDFGQTLGKWGMSPGCYFVLPILGPTTARDAIGLIGNSVVDPVYQITHNTETDMLIGNQNYQEHNYYVFKGTDAVDFRAKNIESFDNVEKNSIDLYSTVKSLYLQNRAQRVLNASTTIETQDESDWEEIQTD
tara:strand:- start:1302 stop:2153 length:852 start_codon:yes stop_codon:yes gene_type:complete